MDQNTIKSLIQKYRAQVEFLQGMIRQLEAELGGQSEVALSPSSIEQPPSGPQAKGNHSVIDPTSQVREWQFFNKSQTDAAEQFLEMINHPLSIGNLLEGLEKGGLKVGGKDVAEKRQNLATVLARSGKFGRAARGTWGLPNWPNITPVTKKDKEDQENIVSNNEKASA